MSSPSRHPTRVVLLAAGFGTRMYPLTEQVAKPLLEVAGRPVLSHLMDQVAAINRGDAVISEVIVVSNQRFADDITAWVASDEIAVSYIPISVVNTGAATAETRNGAVADLAQAMAATAAATDGPSRWLVLAGDNLWGHPLDGYLSAAGDSNAVVCRDLGTDVPPGRFGEVTTDSDSRVIRFREKPAEPTSPLAATCTYFLDAEAPMHVQDYLEGGGNADSPGTFIGWLAQQVPVYALVMAGEYWDIGSFETLDKAKAEFNPPR